MIVDKIGPNGELSNAVRSFCVIGRHFRNLLAKRLTDSMLYSVRDTVRLWGAEPVGPELVGAEPIVDATLRTYENL